jgi:hypothetical protein
MQKKTPQRPWQAAVEQQQRGKGEEEQQKKSFSLQPADWNFLNYTYTSFQTSWHFYGWKFVAK